MKEMGDWHPTAVLIDAAVERHPVADAVVARCRGATTHRVHVRPGLLDAELLDMALPRSKRGGRSASDVARDTLLLHGEGRIFQPMAAGSVPERRCFNFIKLLPYAGVCRASCAYCWFRDPVLLPRVNVRFFDHLPGQIAELARRRGKPLVLTFTHYKTDCFAIEHLTGFVERMCRTFEGLDGCFVQLLTKSDQIQPVLRARPERGTMVAFSVNAECVSDALEGGSASSAKRLQAAQELEGNGIPVLLRVDPMLAVQDWRTAYESLALRVASALRPQQITLGTPRFQSMAEVGRVVEAVQDKAARLMMAEEADKMGEHKPGKPRDDPDGGANAYFRNMPISYPRDLRIELYRSLIDTWRAGGFDAPVGLCEEGADVWDACGLPWRGDKTRDCSCNFVPSSGVDLSRHRGLQR